MCPTCEQNLRRAAPAPEAPLTYDQILTRLNAVSAQLRVLQRKVGELEHRQSV